MSPLLRRVKNFFWKPPVNTLPPFNFRRNRYLAKTQWPPVLRNLPHEQQFRFERKFKRRLRLKAVDEVWNRNVGIGMWSLISFIVVYSVFFHDFRHDKWNPRPGEEVFEPIREWVRERWRGLWTAGSLDLGERGAPRKTDDVERDLIGRPLEGSSIDQELARVEARRAARR